MNTLIEKRQIEQRLKNLEAHLAQENPVLLKVVASFRELDKVAYGLGLLPRNQSFATRVPWWPLISVLGTFSSGKSTFINHYLGYKLQLTGNQAVDDKFTVMCYSNDREARTLPGLALDADPRFPFYRISHDIEEVAAGEGRRVDAYLQLKTCPGDRLRGKILIDSPGFDADAQRTSTLRIINHIVDLSDLVLVFFDARHPEPGAMQDTLQHLVTDTIQRVDSSKFLYILNQMDTTAREDNPEEVVAAWQRALAQRGLTAGRFFRIYNPEAAVPIDDPQRRERFERKRDIDLAEIHNRMQQVETERAYRIIGVLEKTAKRIEDKLVPAISRAKANWRRRVLWTEAFVFGLLLAGLIAASIKLEYWDGLHFVAPWWQNLTGSGLGLGLFTAALLIALLYLHFFIRRVAAGGVIRDLQRGADDDETTELLVNAMHHNTGSLRSVLSTRPAGWGAGARKRIARVIGAADGYVQTLNDQFTDPSGNQVAIDAPAPDQATQQGA